MRDRKLLVLEFNELSPFLLDKWIGESKLPNFKKFRDASDAFIARADVEDSRYLEPWIQWYSLHTGPISGTRYSPKGSASATAPT